MPDWNVDEEKNVLNIVQVDNVSGASSGQLRQEPGVGPRPRRDVPRLEHQVIKKILRRQGQTI